MYSHPQPDSFQTSAITKDAREVRSDIFLQVGNAVLHSVAGVDPFHERLGVMPRCADFAQITFVQFLEPTRLAMTIEVLTDLQSDQFQRARGRGCAGAMRA